MLGNQAAVLYDLGEIDMSFKLLIEIENICSGIDYKEGLAISLMDQAIIDFDNNRPEDALSRSKEACRIVKSCGMKALCEQMRPIGRLIEERVSQRTLLATDGAVENKTIRRADRVASKKH